MIEMLYHLQLDATLGSRLRFMGLELNASVPGPWAGAAAVLLVGTGLFELARRRFVARWGDTQQAIEKEIKLREAP